MKFIETLRQITLSKLTIGLSTVLTIYIWLTVLMIELSFYSHAVMLSLYFATLLSLVILVLIMIKQKSSFVLSRLDFAAIIIIFLFCILNVIFFHEGFRGGRDDGVYANVAMFFAKHNSMYIDSETVASFPGFIQTDNGITMQFYPGYSSWIASIFKLLGYESIRIVNFPFQFLGSMFIYLICKKLFSDRLGIASIIILSTTFPFLWFTRETFTENIFFFIAWFAAYALTCWFTSRKITYLVISVIGISLLTTIRVESIAFLISLLLVVLIGIVIRVYKASIQTSVALLIVFTIFLIPAIYYYLNIDPRYVQEFTNFTNKFVAQLNGDNILNQATSKANQGKDIIENNQPAFAYYLLQLYNIYLFILFIPLAILKSLKVNANKNRYSFLLLLILLLPNFYFLYSPSINLDQPWFLRRYMSVILPFSIVCFCYVLYGVNKRYQRTIFSALVVINLVISANIVFMSEHAGVINTLEKNLSDQFTPKDLVLIDYTNTGHYKIAEPLYFVFDVNTAAVQTSTLKKMLGESTLLNNNLYSGSSFIIPESTICKYNSIYLITTKRPNEIKDVISNRYSTIKEFKLSYKELEKTCELFRLSTSTTPEAMANVEVQKARAFCRNSPSDVFIYEDTLEILMFNRELVDNIQYSCNNRQDRI